MDYDWQHIFKSKTNRELYNIVIGKVVLSNDAIKFAKLELEKRNFDFYNMEANKKAWKLLDLIEDEHNAQLEITSSKSTYLPLRTYLLIITALVSIYFFLNYFTKINFDDGLLVIYVIITTILTGLNNFIYFKQVKLRKERKRKIQIIKNEFEKNNLFKKDSPFQIDIQKHYRKITEGLGTIRMFYIVFLTILMSVLIIRVIINFI